MTQAQDHRLTLKQHFLIAHHEHNGLKVCPGSLSDADPCLKETICLCAFLLVSLNIRAICVCRASLQLIFTLN